MDMLPKFNKKLRTSIILSFLVPVILLILACGLFFYFIAKKATEEEMGRRLKTVANIAAMDAQNWGFTTLAPGDENSRTYRLIVKKLNKISNSANLRKVYLFDEENRSIADSEGTVPIGQKYFNHYLHKKELQKARGQAVSSILFVGDDGRYYKSGFAPVLTPEGELLGFVGVEGSAKFFSSLYTLKRNILLFMIIGTLLTIVIGVVLSSKIVSPIKSLVKASRDIGEGNMSGEIKISSKDEIGFLAHAINEMKENIVERDNRLRAMMQGIAHEVRNPLGGIELFAGLLKDEIKTDLETLQYVEKIDSEIKTLKNLVDEFLDFARNVKPVVSPVDIRTFLEEIKMNFISELQGRNIDLVESLPGDNGKIYFDQDQIKRVLLNIIRNSIEACSKGGKISIKCTTSYNYTIISVEDTGKGISKKDLGRIFEPFFTTKDTGSGLGLSFAKKIVNSHNGDIKVQSAEGGGTTVEIALPRNLKDEL